jgi:hypothetical protein
MEIFSAQNSAQNYNCIYCDLICNKKNDWTRHLLTDKHIRKSGNNMEMTNSANDFTCKCGKKYITNSGLWKHNKKCRLNITKEKILDDGGNKLLLEENADFKTIILDMIKNNSELQKQMIDMCKNNNNNTVINTINNSNNKTFNLQIFLNEQCKNAMNLSDFIDSIKLQMSDLESLGTLGYTEGMHTIIFKEFIDMELFNRPFHCSDLKREIIYIKDDNKWEKEDPENKKLKNAIRGIEKKNFKLLNEWAEQHPKINDCNSPDGDKYLKLLNHATSGDNEHMNKVIKKLAKNIIIDKNMVRINE